MAAAPSRGWWPAANRRSRSQNQRQARPQGGLVWLHVTGPASLSGMNELAQRLLAEDGASVLMTGVLTAGGPGVVLPRGVLQDETPDENSQAVREFLDHWRPDAVVMSEGEIRPALLHECGERQLLLVMADAGDPWFLRGHESWIPGAMRRAISAFSMVFAIDAAAGRAWRKAGLPAARVEATGRMEESSLALPCLEAEREYLAKLMVTRPVWFGARIPRSEEKAVLAAHQHGLQLAHRLLLIILPEDPARAVSLAEDLAAEGWDIASRASEEEPEAETSIFVVNDPAELGLWYRLAPVSYLGGGLSGIGLLTSPLEPAALGSAILHGPRPGGFAPQIGRLGAARAARAVASVRDLSEALGDLLAPDRTARLAQAAWGVVSDGAEVTEGILATLRRAPGLARTERRG
ncbi:3-deoxy-D-manno-octulosonic acid transferase [Xinfangfangia sp. D13-10-4-6]|uniref:3-deoxy-D-manno-octulosonic acid transferase n=1 Tax=Pseudogemmobacter hezensis TaxID=2737662 RepID=UPI0015573934|nr:glycosyltransferase N-terminal domain-containing protein [Pseudogemmobacter hezensis]NPD14220.1 3-deoxy-D-manno-octulosonic acid transferase [Pseudogemmobacter hezensis]